VRIPIHFDDQSRRVGEEVRDVRSNPVLPPEAYAQLITAQPVPQKDLSNRHLFAHCSGARD